MINYQRELTDASTLRGNQGVLGDHTDDAYYKRYLSAAMFIPFTPTGSTSERFDYWVFPPADSTQRVVANVYVPRLWVAGNVEGTVFYAGSAADTNPIRWQWIATGTGLAGSIAVSDVTVSADVAGPAAANTLARYTFTSYLTLLSEDLLIGTRILREGAHANDTYTGDAYLIGLLLRFIPAQQTGDTKGRVP